MTRRRLSHNAAALAFGFLTGLGQVLLLRTFLETVEENEIVLGIFYGVWFLGIIPGAWLGSRTSSRSTRLSLLTPLLLLLQASLLIALLILLRASGTLWGIPVSEVLPIRTVLLLASVDLLPFGFLTGYLFPLLCGLQGGEGRNDEARGAETAIGFVYSWEAIGALLAGVLFTYLFAGHFSAIPLAFWTLALVSVAAASISGRRTFQAIALVLLIVAVTPLPARLESWSLQFWWRSYGIPEDYLARAETPCQALVLAKNGDQFDLLSNGEHDLSFPDDYANVQLAQAALAEKPDARKILLIGGLGHGLAKYWLAAGAERIDVVEPDPGRVDFLLPHLPSADRAALEDERVHLHTTDGRLFVRQQTGSDYDLLVMLTPPPDTIALNRFYTREFYQEAALVLDDRGVLAFQLETAVNYYDEDLRSFLGSVVSALEESFPDVVATDGVVRVFFAARRSGIVSNSPEELVERWRSLKISVEDFSPLLFHTLFEPDASRDFSKVMSSLPRATVNSDLRPVTLRQRLRLWSRIAGGGEELPLEFKPLPIFIAVLLVVIGLAIFLRRTRLRAPHHMSRRLALVAIGTTGFAAIGVSILLLLVYQSARGSLYREVALLMALFMAGLAVGAQSFTKQPPDPRRQLLVAEGCFMVFLAAMGAVVPFLMDKPLLPAAVVLMMLLAGVIAGAEFALAGHLYRQSTADSARAGGMIDAADHLGAFLGAIAVGVLLFPVLGWAGTLCVLALVKGAVLLESFPVSRASRIVEDSGR